MATNFRNIDYGKMLFETLRNYFSVNSAGNMSILYTYLAAFVAVFEAPFAAYVTFRIKEALIANCKWQIGQLTNVLNMLYDATYKRIYVTQSVISFLSDPMFQYAATNFDSDFATAPEQFEREFTDRLSETVVTINVPTSVYSSDLVATVQQIRINGIPYLIQQF